ncbi:TIGR03617 family F420-dependent LLM class oxidoreductase [Spirillospora sp. CA-255316]
MKFDYAYQEAIGDLRKVPKEFHDLERDGYAGIWVREVEHNSFLPIAVGALHTSSIELGNGVAVAFARSPMIAAQLGHDLQLATDGRYVLGLGTQMRGHIVRRFSMPFDPPAARMRDYILAVKAVWSTWNEGEKLDYQGDYYTIDKMPDYFRPRPSAHGPPPVFLGAAGEVMVRIAGEVAEGIVLHSLLTRDYLTSVLRPSWSKGLQNRRAPLTRPFETTAPTLVATGRDEDELKAAERKVRARIAFLGAARPYRRVFDHHGWGRTHERWAKLLADGETARMGDLVDDEMLHAFAVVAEPRNVARALFSRFDGHTDRVSALTPYQTTAEHWSEIAAGVRAMRDEMGSAPSR